MTVVINGVFFLTELDGSFEKYLKNRKVYDFEFMGTGHYPQKKSILIKNGCEYLIKVYLQNKPELIIDKHIDGK